MNSTRRSVRVDLAQDLPQRPRPLMADATSKIFGGCKANFERCDQNYECCSYACAYRVWLSHERRYEYSCAPSR
jgi:hypothetical protein